MGAENDKKSAQETVTEDSEKIRFLSLRNRQTPICIALAALVVTIFCIGGYYVYDYFWGTDTEVEMAWQEELLVKLRDVEIEWDDEMVADWEEKKTYPLDYTAPYALYEVPRFEEEVAVLKVGEETLYTDDFNYYLFIYYEPEFTSGEELSDELLVEVVDALIERSILLQEGAELGLIELQEGMYGSTRKDYDKRVSAMYAVRDSVTESEVASVTGEEIEAWFHNSPPPEMGVEEAREYTQDLITDLRERIVAGTLTFEEAGNEIREDETMKDIDVGVHVNAYSTFEIGGGELSYQDPKIEESMVALEEGEVSEVLVGRSTDSEGNWYDVYFMVAVVHEKSGGSASFEKWMNVTLDRYEILVVST